MQTQAILRMVSLGGVTAAFLWESSRLDFSIAFVWSLLIAVVLAAAVFAAIFYLAPDGWQRLERHPDILVPLGIMVGVLVLTNALLTEGLGLAAPWFYVKLWLLSFPVTVHLLFSLVVHAVFAIWTTVLVVNIVREDQCDLGDAFLRSRSVAIRLLVVLLTGWALGTLLYAIEFPTLFGLGFVCVKAFGSATAIILWTAVLAVLTLRFLISLATAALLPILIESKAAIFPAIGKGIVESWRNRRKWFALLLAQFILVGAYGLVHFQYAHSSGGGHTNTNVNMKLNYAAPWLGDYDYDAGWYGHVMGWLGQEQLSLVTTIAAMLAALLSIVVKLAIVERLASSTGTEGYPVPDFYEEQTAFLPPEPFPDA